MLKGKMLKVKAMKSRLSNALSGEVFLGTKLIDLGVSY